METDMQTILVADDEEGIVEVLACVLEARGYQVLKALNGSDAYAILQERPVDLVISDYMMPGLNGVEMYFRMLEDPSFDNVSFILISAFSGEIAHAPIRAIFPKPFDIEKLLDVVPQALSEKTHANA
jgi:CheY-like chemotaxis protein